MNRTIKFRGKRRDTGKWIYGDLLTSNGTECEISDWNKIDYSRYDVIPETVGQFTGLMDKNGKEIYEGDIVSVKDNTNTDGENRVVRNEVAFKDGAFGIIGEITGNLLPFSDYPIVNEVVVGNIHDNPELLEGGKE